MPTPKMIRFLMDQHDLRQADLLSVFGSRSVASDVLAGKREPSARRTSEIQLFHEPADLFL